MTPGEELEASNDTALEAEPKYAPGRNNPILTTGYPSLYGLHTWAPSPSTSYTSHQYQHPGMQQDSVGNTAGTNIPPEQSVPVTAPTEHGLGTAANPNHIDDAGHHNESLTSSSQPQPAVTATIPQNQHLNWLAYRRACYPLVNGTTPRQLRYASTIEAEIAAIPQGCNWDPGTVHDASFPQTEAEKSVYVRDLLEACLDWSAPFGNAETVARIRRLLNRNIDQLESKCWLVLSRMIRVHTRGGPIVKTRNQLHEQIDEVNKYRGNFAAHVSMMCQLFASKKSQVQQLLNLACDPLEASIADPSFRSDRIAGNQQSNNKRKSDKEEKERQVAELERGKRDEQKRADILQAQLNFMMARTARPTRVGLDQIHAITSPPEPSAQPEYGGPEVVTLAVPEPNERKRTADEEHRGDARSKATAESPNKKPKHASDANALTITSDFHASTAGSADHTYQEQDAQDGKTSAPVPLTESSSGKPHSEVDRPPTATRDQALASVRNEQQLSGPLNSVDPSHEYTSQGSSAVDGGVRAVNDEDQLSSLPAESTSQPNTAKGSFFAQTGNAASTQISERTLSPTFSFGSTSQTGNSNVDPHNLGTDNCVPPDNDAIHSFHEEQQRTQQTNGQQPDTLAPYVSSIAMGIRLEEPKLTEDSNGTNSD